MNINNMTRRDFEQLPYRDRWDSFGVCDSIIILPAVVRPWEFWWYKLRVFIATKVFRQGESEAWEVISSFHDSGYRCIDYIAVKDHEPVCRISGCSDVLHLEGIGGFGLDWLNKGGGVPRAMPPVGWNFDCLPRSGLLRLWCDSKLLIYGCALSSFEIYSYAAASKQARQLIDTTGDYKPYGSTTDDALEHLEKSKRLIE